MVGFGVDVCYIELVYYIFVYYDMVVDDVGVYGDGLVGDYGCECGVVEVVEVWVIDVVEY